MAITEDLESILSARYGKDVRESIHNAIQQCYYDGKAGSIDLEARDEISNLETAISSPYNFKGSCLFSGLPSSATINDTYYVTDQKCRYTWNGSAWYQSSLNESDYEDELSSLNEQLVESQIKIDLSNCQNGFYYANETSLIDSTEWVHVAPLELHCGEKYSFTSKNYSGVTAIYVSDENGNMVKPLIVGKDGDISTIEFISKHKYIGVCFNKSVTPLLVMHTDDKETSIKHYPNLNYGLIYYSQAPTITENFDWEYSEPIRVVKNNVYEIYVRSYSNLCAICECDESGNIIRPVCRGGEDTECSRYVYTPISDGYMIISGKVNVDIYYTVNNSSRICDTVAFSNGIIYADERRNPTLELNDAINNYGVSDVYPIVKGYKYTVKIGAWYNTGLVTLCDENKEVERVIKCGDNDSTSQTFYFIAPRNGYIRLCGSYDKTEPYIYRSAEPVYTYNKNKWCAWGDSLTELNKRAYESYTEVCSNELGLDMQNRGYSGTGYYCWNDYIQDSEIDDFDVMTIFGSGNDIGRKSLGTYTDTTNATLGGCMNITIDKLFNRFPTKKFAVITPTPWAEYCDGVLSGSMEDYTRLLIQVCENRGIPYLDLFRFSNVRPWNETFKTTYYNENGIQDGGVHPNSVGHRQFIAPLVMEFLKSLFN